MIYSPKFRINELGINIVYFRIIFVFFLLIVQSVSAGDQSEKSPTSGLALSVFDIDATPPVGTRLAYDTMINNWDLSLRAKGVVITGSGLPIVICSIDWIGIAGESQDAFKLALAEAVGTSPERVAVHTLHQHDAPRSDLGAERILKEAGLDPGSYDGKFTREFIIKLANAVIASMENAVPVTHVGHGEAVVDQVASNRRILGADGKVKATRWTACKDSALRAEPEGLIDPKVFLLSFWNEDSPVALLSYYACHPQSYYRTGIANPDFPGIARFYRQLALPDAIHIHFNGAGGNIGAGKYNDGSKENREVLASRLADGMKRAWEATRKEKISSAELQWRVEPVLLPPAKHIEMLADAPDSKEPEFLLKNASELIWLQRYQLGITIDIACLYAGNIRILHMPGELCVEYQLHAKAFRKDLFVAMAAYGDYGAGYICTAEAYKQGGYEAGTASGVSPGAEKIIMNAINKLLKF